MQRNAATSDAKSLSDLLAGLELAGQTWCYTDIGPRTGFSVPPGDALHLHYVLHGTARLACTGGEMVELAAGEGAFVLSGEAHALRTARDCPANTHDFLREERQVDVPPTVSLSQSGPVAARVLSARLRVRWPGEVKRPALPSLMPLDWQARGPLAALLRTEALAQAGMGAGSAALLTRLASLMLVAGLRTDPRCRQHFSPAQQDPIAQALQLIETNPSASWTVEKLARSVGMGRSNFAAHFTQTIGRAPMEVVAEHRMEHAASLLRQGNLKIAEISEMAGYSSEAAFSRRFTRHFGISPSQMRLRARADAEMQPVARGRFSQFLATRLTEGATSAARLSGVAAPRPGNGKLPQSPGGLPFFGIGVRD